MIYEKFGKGDERAHSLLGFGLMRLPTLEGEVIDTNEANRLVQLAHDSGVNYYDTAYMYHDGKSEEYLRSFFADHPRENILIADKLPIWAINEPADLERIFTMQLARCGVHYFDYYLAHALSAQHAERMKQFGAVEFLERKRREGYIRHLGFSFHDDDKVLDEVMGMCSWDFCQLQLNYADWHRFGASKLYAVAEAHNMPIIVMEPVRGGFLANPPEEAARLLREANPERSYASWAMRYVASLPMVKLVLSGMSSYEQVEDNLRTFCDCGVYLSDEEQAVMQRVIEVMDGIATVPCTGCRYCMPCPQGVNIPRVFTCYNNAKFLSRGDGDYGAMPEDTRADRCVGCKACEGHCPQQLSIVSLLAEAHTELTKE